MKHRQRLDRLKRKLLREPILLRMADGSTVPLPGRSDYLLDLMLRSLSGEWLPAMDLIAQSVGSHEPGGAHMVDMARLLHAAVNDEAEPTTTSQKGE